MRTLLTVLCMLLILASPFIALMMGMRYNNLHAMTLSYLALTLLGGGSLYLTQRYIPEN